MGLFKQLTISETDTDVLPAISKVFTVERLYPETVITIGLLLDVEKIIPDTKLWKKFWHLYRVELIGVESTDVARSMVSFGNELTRLSLEQSAPSLELRSLAAGVIDAMAKDFPNIANYKAKLQL